MSMLSMKRCYKIEDEPYLYAYLRRKLLVYAVNLAQLSKAPVMTRYDYYSLHLFRPMFPFWGGACKIAPDNSFMKGMR